MEPLIPLTLVPLEQANKFLASITGVELDFSIKQAPPSPLKRSSSRRSGDYALQTPPTTYASSGTRMQWQASPKPMSGFSAGDMDDSNTDLRSSRQSLESEDQRVLQFGYVEMDSMGRTRVSLGSLNVKEYTDFKPTRRHSAEIIMYGNIENNNN